MSPLIQTVEIHLGEGLCDEQLTQQDHGYHFAVSGRAFAVITEHFPHLVQKVTRYNRAGSTVLTSCGPDVDVILCLSTWGRCSSC